MATMACRQARGYQFATAAKRTCAPPTAKDEKACSSSGAERSGVDGEDTGAMEQTEGAGLIPDFAAEREPCGHLENVGVRVCIVSRTRRYLLSTAQP